MNTQKPQNCPEIPVSSEDMKKCKKWYRPLLTLIIVAIFALFCFSVSPKVGAATDDSDANLIYYLEVQDSPVLFNEFYTDPLTNSNNQTNDSFKITIRNYNNEEDYNYITFYKSPGNLFCSVYYTKNRFVDLSSTSEDLLVYDASEGLWNSDYVPFEVLDSTYISRDFYDRFFSVVFPEQSEDYIKAMRKISGWYTFNDVLASVSPSFNNSPLRGTVRYTFEDNDEIYSYFDFITVSNNTDDIYLTFRSSTTSEFTDFLLTEEGTQKIDERFKVLLFSEQYIDETLYRFLMDNGNFRYMAEVEEDYTATDLLFGIVDIPFYYLSQYLNISIFNTTLLTVFCTIITIGLAIYVFKVFK